MRKGSAKQAFKKRLHDLVANGGEKSAWERKRAGGKNALHILINDADGRKTAAMAVAGQERGRFAGGAVVDIAHVWQMHQSRAEDPKWEKRAP